ncbi:unnamed protein product [Lactuca virosa]|uniref:Reverse transcriptase domain-containing protein n=1 Tax=Lactuca virosa TaxID=75947 RepID=A0AAU9P1H4_9ASTR|nr:unnamed protein product [Lactuca virosa]
MININGNFHGFFQGKRGLRQGCPLSPYLFTLVMEVFNLMLKRSIRENASFKYHWRYSAQKITHLCFADDLMLFCHGNTGSIRIVKKAMDEFAGTAGLIPNLSKSHIFFGNVKEPLNRRILDVLPFVEGKFPMKGITNDIEKIMRNFLWKSGENKKGVAKVAWNEICKPKIYGGLGLKNLKYWNIALLSSIIWKILSGQNSLWVKWVNSYLLEDRSFWDVGYKDKMSWSWRNLLKIRLHLREFFYVQIGNGEGTFMWFDNWHQLGTLSYVLSPREIGNAGYNIRDRVSDVIVNEEWSWPADWLRMIPQLGEYSVPSLIRGKKDTVFWLNWKGNIVPFAVNQVSSSLICHESKVDWHDLVWFQNRIPSHYFILWFAILGRLRTQDRMKNWKDSNEFCCAFCNNQVDSHSHLFFECNFPMEVWDLMKGKVKLKHKPGNWFEIIQELQCSLKVRSIDSFIKKIALAASIYHIWNERNKRLFGRERNSVENVVKNIIEDIKTQDF